MTRAEFFQKYLFNASEFPPQNSPHLGEFESYLDACRIVPIGNNLYMFTYLGAQWFLNSLKVEEPETYNVVIEQISLRAPFLLRLIKHIASETASGQALRMIEQKYVDDIRNIEQEGLSAINLGLLEADVAPLVNEKRRAAALRRNLSILPFVNSVPIE